MLDALEAHWADRGLADRLHTERFRPTVVVTGDGGTVTFTAQRLDVDADGAHPAARRRRGRRRADAVGLPHGHLLRLRRCRCAKARCATCATATLTTAAPGDGVLVQTCVSAAAGACDIEL